MPKLSPEKMAALVEGVRDYALRNYNRSGWDYVIETYSDADIVAAIDKATSVGGAIINVRAAVKPMSDYRAEIVAEADDGEKNYLQSKAYQQWDSTGHGSQPQRPPDPPAPRKSLYPIVVQAKDGKWNFGWESEEALRSREHGVYKSAADASQASSMS